MAAESEDLDASPPPATGSKPSETASSKPTSPTPFHLSTLKRHQDRIRIAELAQVTNRLDADFGDHDDPGPTSPPPYGLLANCATMYNRSDDLGKRLSNQAFYTKVLHRRRRQQAARSSSTEPFDTLTDPHVNVPTP